MSVATGAIMMHTPNQWWTLVDQSEAQQWKILENNSPLRAMGQEHQSDAVEIVTNPEMAERVAMVGHPRRQHHCRKGKSEVQRIPLGNPWLILEDKSQVGV